MGPSFNAAQDKVSSPNTYKLKWVFDLEGSWRCVFHLRNTRDVLNEPSKHKWSVWTCWF